MISMPVRSSSKMALERLYNICKSTNKEKYFLRHKYVYDNNIYIYSNMYYYGKRLEICTISSKLNWSILLSVIGLVTYWYHAKLELLTDFTHL